MDINRICSELPKFQEFVLKRINRLVGENLEIDDVHFKLYRDDGSVGIIHSKYRDGNEYEGISIYLLLLSDEKFEEELERLSAEKEAQRQGQLMEIKENIKRREIKELKRLKEKYPEV